MNCLDYLIMEVIDNFDTITTKKEIKTDKKRNNII